MFRKELDRETKVALVGAGFSCLVAGAFLGIIHPFNEAPEKIQPSFSFNQYSAEEMGIKAEELTESQVDTLVSMVSLRCGLRGDRLITRDQTGRILEVKLKTARENCSDSFH